jgi:hypothetical protein
MTVVFKEMMKIYFPMKTKKYWKRKYNFIVSWIPSVVLCDICNNTKPLSWIKSNVCGPDCNEHYRYINYENDDSD